MPSPPQDITYTRPEAYYTLGFAIKRNAPTYFGDQVTSASVFPELPVGLNLDELSGMIFGMPLSATAKESYTVTLSNRGGSSTVIIKIKVSLGNFGYFVPSANAMVTRLNLNDFETTEVG
jgi:hypothetical protein